jgi:hypothetical protein
VPKPDSRQHLEAIAEIADQACMAAQQVADALNRSHGLFPTGVRFLLVAYDPRDGGGHAVTTTSVNPHEIRVALEAAKTQLEKFLRAHARAVED